MGKFKVKVTQRYTVDRVVVMDIEANDQASAVERVESGDVDLPKFEDPVWTAGWGLQFETMEAQA
jgi:hypothetical protein